MDEPFRLENEPPAHQPERFDDNPRGRQGVLLSGLDCLRGQADLFATDGEDTRQPKPLSWTHIET